MEWLLCALIIGTNVDPGNCANETFKGHKISRHPFFELTLSKLEYLIEKKDKDVV